LPHHPFVPTIGRFHELLDQSVIAEVFYRLSTKFFNRGRVIDVDEKLKKLKSREFAETSGLKRTGDDEFIQRGL
jgi:hypothetical protein